MGCIKCDFTGIAYEYDETCGPGYVEISCPECIGIDGEEPDWVTEQEDVLTEMEDVQAIATRKPEQELACALEHLVKAGEKLGQESSSTQAYITRHDTQWAITYVRFALKRLRQEKEEPCNKS